MKIEFNKRAKRDNVVFELVGETDSEVALLSLIFGGPRWLEMESFEKIGNTFGRICVSQQRMDSTND